MNSSPNRHDYSELAQKIEKKQRRIVNTAMIAALLSIFGTLCLSMILHILYSDKEFNFSSSVIIHALIAVFLWELVAISRNTSAVNNALLLEANPHKYLALRCAVERAHYVRKRDKELARMEAYYLMGDFSDATPYAEQSARDCRSPNMLVGIYYLAVMAFFSKKTDAFDAAVAQFRDKLQTVRMNENTRAAWSKTSCVIDLMEAILHDEREKMKQLTSTLPMDLNRCSDVGAHCVKGLACEILGEREQAKFEFQYTIVRGEHLFFAVVAQNGLARLDQASKE